MITFLLTAFSLISNICNTSYIDNSNFIQNHNNLDHPYTVAENQFIHRHYVNGYYRSPKSIKLNLKQELEYNPPIWIASTYP